MKRSILNPIINIRMAVLDICEVTRWKEPEALSLLSERLEQGFMNRLNLDIESIYFEHEQYKFPARQALTYLSLIQKGVLDWEFPINEAVDRYGRTSPESIPFEHFHLTPRDLFLIVNPIVDFEMFGLKKIWSINVSYDKSRINGTLGEYKPTINPTTTTKNAIKSTFSRIDDKSWDNFFDRDADLKAAFVRKKGRENLYSLSAVAKWLIETGKGGYTNQEVLGLLAEKQVDKTTPKRIPGDFSDMLSK